MTLSAERSDGSLVPRETVIQGLTSRGEGSPFAFEPLIKPIFDPEPEIPRYFGMPRSSRTLYRWWNKISRFIDEKAHGRRNSPTYHAVTGQFGDLELARILGEAGLIRSGTQIDLENNLLKLPAVDQLALSRLDTASVVSLGDQGYGFWPVIDSGEINGVDKKHEHILSGAKEWNIRDINGLWFRDQRLVSDYSPMNQGYLPTAPEVLRAFELFFDQEGFHPDSRGRWFLTRSFITESFQDVSRFIASLKPEEIFLQGCIEYCTHKRIVQKLLDKKADSDEGLPTGIRVEKDSNKGSLKITYQDPEDLTAGIPVVEKLFRDRVFVMGSNGEYLFVQGRNGTLELEGGFLTIKNKSSELRVSYNDVIKEIIAQKKKAEAGFEQELDLPVVINAGEKTGVRVGISLQAAEEELDDMSAFVFAQGKLKVHYGEGVEELLEKKFKGTPIVWRHSLPLIFPDQYARRLAVNKV